MKPSKSIYSLRIFMIIMKLFLEYFHAVCLNMQYAVFSFVFNYELVQWDGWAFIARKVSSIREFERSSTWAYNSNPQYISFGLMNNEKTRTSDIKWSVPWDNMFSDCGAVCQQIQNLPKSSLVGSHCLWDISFSFSYWFVNICKLGNFSTHYKILNSS